MFLRQYSPTANISAVTAIALVTSFQVFPAQGETQAAALSAVSDTADRICGIVATIGQSDSTKVSGDVHAELTGLARRLASAGVSGAGDITSTNYQNVLQTDLAATLKDVRDCKLKVFERLAATTLPGVPLPSTGRGAPSEELLRSPSSAPLVDFVKNYSGLELGLYNCFNVPAPAANARAPGSIACYGTATKNAQGAFDYHIEHLFPQQTKLVDNLHIDHRLRRAFFLDGVGRAQPIMNLSAGESIWWSLEFEPGPQPVSSARIVLGYGQLQLQSPVS
jgi:hypothetical protein